MGRGSTLSLSLSGSVAGSWAVKVTPGFSLDCVAWCFCISGVSCSSGHGSLSVSCGQGDRRIRRKLRQESTGCFRAGQATAVRQPRGGCAVCSLLFKFFYYCCCYCLFGFSLLFCYTVLIPNHEFCLYFLILLPITLGAREG